MHTINFNDILIKLTNAVKMHNLYPAGHPNFDLALGRVFEVLRKDLEGGDIKLNITLKGFVRDKTVVLPGNDEVADLAKRFFYRRVKEITFTPELTKADLNKFFTVIWLEPEEIRLKGGAETVIAEEGVNGILLNEMSYEYLRELKRGIAARREAEKSAEEDRKKKEEAAGTPGGVEEKEKKQEDGSKPSYRTAPERTAAPPAREPAREETIAELVERLRTERDIIRYTDAAVRAVEKCRAVMAARLPADAYPVVALLHDHASPASTLPLDLRMTSLEKLEELLTPDMLRYLVGRVGEKSDPEREKALQLVLRGADQAVELLLEALTVAKDAATRRNLFNAAALFGRRLVPFVERSLGDPNWFVVRQMVALLGEVADLSTVQTVMAAYNHADPRVKKEAIKSLARMKSPESRDFLIRALSESDLSIVSQAVIALSMHRDPATIEPLARIAERRDPFSSNQDPRMEAIKALGVIGDRAAVAPLARILAKKTWFGRKVTEEARLLAAKALGAIGGEEAMKAIDEAGGGAEGELKAVCKRLIEGSGQ